MFCLGPPNLFKVDTQDEVVKDTTKVFGGHLARALAFEEAPGSSVQEEPELFRFSMEDFLPPTSRGLRSPSSLKQQHLATWPADATTQTERRQPRGTSTPSPAFPDKALVQEGDPLPSFADITQAQPCSPPLVYCRTSSFGLINKPIKGNLLCESLPFCASTEEDDNVFYRPATQADLCSTHPAVDLAACPATWSGAELWKHFCEANEPSGDSSNDEETEGQLPVPQTCSASSSPRAGTESTEFDNLLKAATEDAEDQERYYLILDSLAVNPLACEAALFGYKEPCLGENHQAELPQLLTEEEKRLARAADEERAGVLEWSPDMLEEEQVDKYLAYVRSVLEADFSLEEALRRLHQHKYDVNQTLAAFLLNPSDFKKKEVWTEDEESRFIQGYYLYRKNWSQISKQLLPEKTPAALMQYYYNWRKGWYNEDEEQSEEEADAEDSSDSEPSSPCADWPTYDTRGLPGRRHSPRAFEDQDHSEASHETGSRKRVFDTFQNDDQPGDEEVTRTNEVGSNRAASHLAESADQPNVANPLSVGASERDTEDEVKDEDERSEHRSKKIRLGSAPLVCQAVPATWSNVEEETSSSLALVG